MTRATARHALHVLWVQVPQQRAPCRATRSVLLAWPVLPSVMPTTRLAAIYVRLVLSAKEQFLIALSPKIRFVLLAQVAHLIAVWPIRVVAKRAPLVQLALVLRQLALCLVTQNAHLAC
jgi:hypothetical protein